MAKKVPKTESKTQVLTNAEYLTGLLKLLGKAKKSVDILSFSFAIGSARGKIAEKQAPYEIAQKIVEIKKKNPKLRIRFFTEGLRETVDRNRVTADFLKAHGVIVQYGSTHAKGFCVDERFLLLGSTNLTNQSLTKNNEANLLLDDKKASKEFLRYFEHLWKGGHHGGIELNPPLVADGDFKDVLIEVIDRAKKKIHFSIYFFNHREIESAIIRAHERGVAVTGFIHQHTSFALPYIWANRSTVKRMRAAGMDDLHFSVPTTFSHSKYLVCDGKELMLGTGNWLVEDVVIHPQLYLHLTDPKVARALIRHLTWQIKNQSD